MFKIVFRQLLSVKKELSIVRVLQKDLGVVQK